MATITAYTVPEVIDTARRAGLGEVADRLDYLHRLPLENGADPMDPDSARSLVDFLTRHHRDLPKPGITASADGHVHADLEFAGDSDVDIEFLPSGDVWFIYSDRDQDTGSYKIRETKMSTQDYMLKRIMPRANHAM